jgi:hypothetical protein
MKSVRFSGMPPLMRSALSCSKGADCRWLSLSYVLDIGSDFFPLAIAP